MKQANQNSIITTTSVNLSKRLVQAKEPATTYQEALKREDLQVHHDSQHNEDERHLIEVRPEIHQEHEPGLQDRSNPGSSD